MMFRLTFLFSLLVAGVVESTVISSLSPEAMETTLRNKSSIGDVIVFIEDLKMPHVTACLMSLSHRADMNLKLKLRVLDLKRIRRLWLQKRKNFLKKLVTAFPLKTGRPLETIILPQINNPAALDIFRKLQRKLDVSIATIKESSAPVEVESEADEPGPDFDAFGFVFEFIVTNGVVTNPDSGLAVDEIAALPSGNPIDEECAICLASLKHFALDAGCQPIVADLVQLPSCKHVFHRVCMIPWLAKNSTCPYCVGKILE